MSVIKGAGVAIVTPMYDNEEVNYDKLGELWRSRSQEVRMRSSSAARLERHPHSPTRSIWL